MSSQPKRVLAALVLAFVYATPGHSSVSAPAGQAAPAPELPVPSGTAALLRAAGVRVPVEPERALLVLVRHLHAGRTDARQIEAVIARAAVESGKGPGDHDHVPALLPHESWQRAVFGRTVPAEGLAAAILRDRQAAFLYQGLFALDDETLAFVAASPALLETIYRRLAASFAAYSEGIRIRDGRVIVPGGPAAEAAWQQVLLASPADPPRFVASLLERDHGRAAQLFEALGRLDGPHLAFALGPSAGGTAALAAAAGGFDAHAQLPFSSWSDVDVPFLLEQVRVTPDGHLASPRGRAFWEAALAGAVRPRSEAGSPGDATSAWLVSRFAALPAATRRRRLDALLFTQRLASRSDAGEHEWLETAASFPAWQTLFLTLEQVGATDPGDYRAAALAAEALTAGRDPIEASRRLAVFQSAIAIVARLVRVRTLAPPSALELMRDLFGRAGVRDTEYAVSMADWIERGVLARLPGADVDAGADAESRLIDGLAGMAFDEPARPFEWEGRLYAVDLAGAERQRLGSVREGQGGPTLDEVLALPRSGPAGRRGLGSQLAEVLVALVYALVTDPDAPMVSGDGPWRRHDFALDGGAAAGPWRFAQLKAGRGATGSLIGMERTLAREALRPTMMGLPPRPPTLTLEDATGLAESVVALDPSLIDDEGRDQLAGALREGRARLVAAVRRPGDLEALLVAAGVDGTRRRLARVAAAREPWRVLEYVSLGEVLRLGREASPVPDAVADHWGTAARLVDGSLGQRMPWRLAWRERSGRPGSGLVAAHAADLQLRVAEWLSDRRLPAALAGAILSLAAWDLVMNVQAANADDWLPVVRAGQSVPAQRLEDYVSALAAGGPLVPAGAGR